MTAKDLKEFQEKYSLSNRQISELCGCSIPTIQKWRAGDIKVSETASRLLRLLDWSSQGSVESLQKLAGNLDRKDPPQDFRGLADDQSLQALESNMNQVMDRLQLMLKYRRKKRDFIDIQNRYESMLEAHGDPVCRWQLDTVLTYTNQAYQSLFGSPDESLIGKKWIEFLPEEERAGTLSIISDLARRGESQITRDHFISQDGTRYYHEWRDIPVKNEQGQVEEFHSIGRDFSRLEKVESRLGRVENTLQSIVEMVEKPLVVFDDSGKILNWNEAFTELLGITEPWRNLSEFIRGTGFRNFSKLLPQLKPGGICRFRFIYNESLFLLSASPVIGEQRLFYSTLQRLGDGSSLSQLKRERINIEQSLCEWDANQYSIKGRDSTQIKDSIQSTLAWLGKHVVCDRVYVFGFEDNYRFMSNLFEWCAEGVSPQMDELMDIPTAEYSWWLDRLCRNKWIQVEDTNKMPQEAKSVQSILKAQGIKSLLVAPVCKEEILLGFIGFDVNQEPRRWHAQEKELLRGAADLVSMALAGFVEVPQVLSEETKDS